MDADDLLALESGIAPSSRRLASTPLTPLPELRNLPWLTEADADQSQEFIWESSPDSAARQSQELDLGASPEIATVNKDSIPLPPSLDESTSEISAPAAEEIAEASCPDAKADCQHVDGSTAWQEDSAAQKSHGHAIPSIAEETSLPLLPTAAAGAHSNTQLKLNPTACSNAVLMSSEEAAARSVGPHTRVDTGPDVPPTHDHDQEASTASPELGRIVGEVPLPRATKDPSILLHEASLSAERSQPFHSSAAILNPGSEHSRAEASADYNEALLSARDFSEAPAGCNESLIPAVGFPGACDMHADGHMGITADEIKAALPGAGIMLDDTDAADGLSAADESCLPYVVGLHSQAGESACPDMQPLALSAAQLVSGGISSASGPFNGSLQMRTAGTEGGPAPVHTSTEQNAAHAASSPAAPAGEPSAAADLPSGPFQHNHTDNALHVEAQQMDTTTDTPTLPSALQGVESSADMTEPCCSSVSAAGMPSARSAALHPPAGNHAGQTSIADSMIPPAVEFEQTFSARRTISSEVGIQTQPAAEVMPPQISPGQMHPAGISNASSTTDDEADGAMTQLAASGPAPEMGIADLQPAPESIEDQGAKATLSEIKSSRLISAGFSPDAHEPTANIAEQAIPEDLPLLSSEAKPKTLLSSHAGQAAQCSQRAQSTAAPAQVLADQRIANEPLHGSGSDPLLVNVPKDVVRAHQNVAAGIAASSDVDESERAAAHGRNAEVSANPDQAARHEPAIDIPSPAADDKTSADTVKQAVSNGGHIDKIAANMTQQDDACASPQHVPSRESVAGTEQSDVDGTRLAASADHEPDSVVAALLNDVLANIVAETAACYGPETLPAAAMAKTEQTKAADTCVPSLQTAVGDQMEHGIQADEASSIGGMPGVLAAAKSTSPIGQVQASSASVHADEITMQPAPQSAMGTNLCGQASSGSNQTTASSAQPGDIEPEEGLMSAPMQKANEVALAQAGHAGEAQAEYVEAESDRAGAFTSPKDAQISMQGIQHEASSLAGTGLSGHEGRSSDEPSAQSEPQMSEKAVAMSRSQGATRPRDQLAGAGLAGTALPEHGGYSADASPAPSGPHVADEPIGGAMSADPTATQVAALPESSTLDRSDALMAETDAQAVAQLQSPSLDKVNASMGDTDTHGFALLQMSTRDDLDAPMADTGIRYAARIESSTSDKSAAAQPEFSSPNESAAAQPDSSAADSSAAFTDRTVIQDGTRLQSSTSDESDALLATLASSSSEDEIRTSYAMNSSQTIHSGEQTAQDESVPVTLPCNSLNGASAPPPLDEEASASVSTCQPSSSIDALPMQQSLLSQPAASTQPDMANNADRFLPESCSLPTSSQPGSRALSAAAITEDQIPPEVSGTLSGETLSSHTSTHDRPEAADMQDLFLAGVSQGSPDPLRSSHTGTHNQPEATHRNDLLLLGVPQASPDPLRTSHTSPHDQAEAANRKDLSLPGLSNSSTEPQHSPNTTTRDQPGATNREDLFLPGLSNSPPSSPTAGRTSGSWKRRAGSPSKRLVPQPEVRTFIGMLGMERSSEEMCSR